MITTMLAASSLGYAPYPTPLSPTGTAPLFLVSRNGLSNADRTTLATLSGLLARDTPQIYAIDADPRPFDPTNPNAYDLWLSELETQYSVKTDASYLHDFNGLLAHFIANASAIVGYVRFNETDGSANAAFSYCAAVSGSGSGSGSRSRGTSRSPSLAEDAVNSGVIAVASASTAQYLDMHGVPMVRDLSGTTEGALLAEIRSAAQAFPANFSFRSESTTFQLRTQTENLVAYSIFARIPTIEYRCTGISNATESNKCLARYPEGGPIAQARLAAMKSALGDGNVGYAMGWGPEGDYVTALAKKGVVVHASDDAHDMPALNSLHTHASVAPTRPLRQPLGGRDVRAHDAEVFKKKVEQKGNGTHTVAFLMTDGDNIQFLVNAFASSPKYFSSPDRGKGASLSFCFVLLLSCRSDLHLLFILLSFCKFRWAGPSHQPPRRSFPPFSITCTARPVRMMTLSWRRLELAIRILI